MSTRDPMPPDPSGLDPVAAYLDNAETDESAIHRVWRGVDQRLTGAIPRRRSVSVRVLAGVALAGVALAAALVVVVSLWPNRALPIALESGGALVATEVSVEAHRLALSDGSVVLVDPGARLVPTRNDARALSLRVEGGRVRFEVQPGGPRVWMVHTEWFTVRVVGTVFVVEDGADGGSVRVERGEVLVTEIASGERFALRAGEERGFERARAGEPAHDSTEVDAGATSSSASTSTGGASAAPPSTPTTLAPPGTLASPVSERSDGPEIAQGPPDWRQLARQGELGEAYEALGDTVPEISADLLLAVDVARRTGHEERAVALLETILSEHPRSAEASLAAITLGRIERRRRNYVAALAAFDQARALGVPSSFADEVCAERALARHASGDRIGARQVAGECLGLNGASVYAPRLRPLLRAE